MKILGVIPARFASTRFPGKPLADIGGKTMIQRVAEQALKSKKLSKVVVATDDERIFNHVVSLGIEAIMTSASHRSGTDRVIEVSDKFESFDAYVNIQGDEPFILPAQIDLVCEPLIEKKGSFVSTLIKRTFDANEIANPNVVKVVYGRDHQALLFSRSPIPFHREIPSGINSEKGHFKHIGIYGYTNVALDLIRWMEPGKLEKFESLEQLRWLENGIPIYLMETKEETLSIDTPDDLERAKKMV